LPRTTEGEEQPSQGLTPEAGCEAQPKPGREISVERHGGESSIALRRAGAAWTHAREARRPASPEALRAEITALVEELAPTPETRAAIGVKLAACGESARDLARLVNLLREKVASKGNDTEPGTPAQEAT